MLKRFRPYKNGEFVVVGVDTSAGGNDYTACQFLSKSYLDVPTVIHTKSSITEVTPLIKQELDSIFDQTGIKPIVAYERQNGGVFELERLSRLNRDQKYNIFVMPTYGSVNNSEESRIGWDTNTLTRPKMLQELKELVDSCAIKLYHKETVNELFSFIISKTGKPQAETKSHDDLVMSLSIAYQLYLTCQPPRDETMDELELEMVNREDEEMLKKYSV